MLAGEILQPQQIAFEISLIMKVNIKTRKVGVLWKQIFGRRICGIRKECIRIERPADLNQLLDKFNYPTRTEPACHRARDFVADQITKNCRMPRVSFDGSADIFRDLFANGSFTQE